MLAWNESCADCVSYFFMRVFEKCSFAAVVLIVLPSLSRHALSDLESLLAMSRVGGGVA